MKTNKAKLNTLPSDGIVAMIRILIYSLILFFLINNVNSFTYIYDNYDSSVGISNWNKSTDATGGHLILDTKHNVTSPNGYEYTSGTNTAYANYYYRLNKTFVAGDGHIIIEEWVKFNDTTSNYLWFGLLNNMAASSVFYMYMLLPDTTNSVKYKNAAGSDVVGCAINYPALVNNWVNVSIDYDYGATSSYVTIYVNGTICANHSNAYAVTSALYYGRLDFSSGYGSTTFNDNLCIFNTSCDNGIAPPDTTPPTITFKEQIPNNIIFGNAFGNAINITYNITDKTNNLNTDTIYLNSSINISGQLINSYTNGTPDYGYIKRGISSNSTSNYTFRLFDNDIFYGLYNYNESRMEELTKSRYDCGQSICLYYGEFYNFSNRNPNNILELNLINNGTNPQLFNIGLCNERVLNPLISSNCTSIYSNTAIPINHSHQNGKSNHSTLQFTFDSSSGKINGVWINGTIYPYVYVNNNPAKVWLLSYVNVESRKNANVILNSAGIGFNDLNATWDMHIHQNASILQYYACASDTAGNFNCSEQRKVGISTSGNLAPDSPIITNPNQSITFFNPLNNLTYISWQYGAIPSGNAISYCSLTSFNANNFTFMNTINISVPAPITATYWKFVSNITDERINLTCCDTIGLCSNYISNNISIFYYDIGLNVTPTVPNGTTVIININTSAFDNIANQTKYNVDIWLIVLFLTLGIVMLIIGSMTPHKFLIILSGGFILISSLFFGNYARNIGDNTIYIYIFFVFLIFSIAIILLGIVLTFTEINNGRRKNNFYDDVDSRYNRNY